MTPDEQARRQRLMELVEAEDAANGEVGCGRRLGKGVSGQFSHHVIHQAVRHPRHTWTKPIWILEGQNQLYIVQAGSMEEAIAQVKQQHPQEAEALTVVKVGGVLAPNQVITLG